MTDERLNCFLHSLYPGIVLMTMQFDELLQDFAVANCRMKLFSDVLMSTMLNLLMLVSEYWCVTEITLSLRYNYCGIELIIVRYT